MSSFPSDPSPQDTPARGPKTILVVDDEEVVRNTAGLALRHAGFEVLLAEDGRSAVEVLQRAGTEISLVLLDLTMPAMGGVDVLHYLREQNIHVPAILSSGFDESEAVGRLAGKAVAGFLKKPYRAGTLIAAVRKALP